MKWSEKIIQAHTAVTGAVSHSARLKSERYFVWQENGTHDFIAENRHAERAITGTTDFFTKQEFDPWVSRLGASFDHFGIAWALESIQYEEDTEFYHYEWRWEVLDGG